MTDLMQIILKRVRANHAISVRPTTDETREAIRQLEACGQIIVRPLNADCVELVELPKRDDLAGITSKGIFLSDFDTRKVTNG